MKCTFNTFALAALLVATVVVSTGYCSDPATHLAVARRSLAVWQDFDPAFYSVITGSPTTDYGRWFQKMTLKFYYIGTTLPDLFFSEQQSAASALLEWLYNNRCLFLRNWPLWIEQSTYDNSRSAMWFPAHHSLETLEGMARYARSMNWSAIEKALISRIPEGPDLDWLVRRDVASCWAGNLLSQSDGAWMVKIGSPLECQTDPGRTQGDETDTPRISGWKRVGIYGLEFCGAGAGSFIAGVAGYGVDKVVFIASGYNLDAEMIFGTGAALLTYLLTSPFLSAAGTSLTGKIVREKGSFWHAVVGGVAGAVVGPAVAYGYLYYWSSRHNYSGTPQAVILSGCMLLPPALGAVIAYNLW